MDGSGILRLTMSMRPAKDQRTEDNAIRAAIKTGTCVGGIGGEDGEELAALRASYRARATAVEAIVGGDLRLLVEGEAMGESGEREEGDVVDEVDMFPCSSSALSSCLANAIACSTIISKGGNCTSVSGGRTALLCHCT